MKEAYLPFYTGVEKDKRTVAGIAIAIEVRVKNRKKLHCYK